MFICDLPFHILELSNAGYLFSFFSSLFLILYSYFSVKLRNLGLKLAARIKKPIGGLWKKMKI